METRPSETKLPYHDVGVPRLAPAILGAHASAPKLPFVGWRERLNRFGLRSQYLLWKCPQLDRSGAAWSDAGGRAAKAGGSRSNQLSQLVPRLGAGFGRQGQCRFLLAAANLELPDVLEPAERPDAENGSLNGKTEGSS